MGFELTPRDREKLAGVNPALVRVVERAAALSPRRFTVLEGLRSVERQRRLVAKGASKTMNSRHITGHAVDLAPVDDEGNVSWAWPLYDQLAPIVKRAAKDCGVAIEWGGDWKSFRDGPHWQLPWDSAPVKPPAEVARDKPITEPRRDQLSKSRTVRGAAVSAGGGVVVLAAAAKDTADQFKAAQDHISTGDWLGMAIGALIVLGACYALYARWQDAGSPKLWGKG